MKISLLVSKCYLCMNEISFTKKCSKWIMTRIYFWFLHEASNWNKEKRIIILTSEWCVYELAEVTKDLFCFNIFLLNKCYNLTALSMISDLKALRSMDIGCTFELMCVKTNESIEVGCVQRFYCMNTPQSDPQL